MKIVRAEVAEKSKYAKQPPLLCHSGQGRPECGPPGRGRPGHHPARAGR